jgi:hypothetical protein
VDYHQYHQHQTSLQAQAEFREVTSRQYYSDPDFWTLIQIYFEELAPDESLKGKDLEVDQYRKGIMRDGIMGFYQMIERESLPSVVNEGDTNERR